MFNIDNGERISKLEYHRQNQDLQLNVILMYISSSHVDSMEFPDSLNICPNHPSLQAGPVDCIQCLHQVRAR